MVDEKLKAVKSKIAKLLAHAQGTSNEAEAALYMEKVEAMLDEYQLSEWEINADNDLMGSDIMLEGTSSSPTWQRHLICALASYYGCSPVRRRGLGPKWDGFAIDVIGRESSRVTVQLMHPFVLGQLREAGRRLHNEGHNGSRDALTRRVANALVHRIYVLINERKTEGVTTRHDAMKRDRALVVVNEIKSWIENEYGALKQGIARQRSTTEAARKAASGISIERQVTGKGQLKLGHG